MEKIKEYKMYKFGTEIKVPGFKPTKPFNTGYVWGSDPSIKKKPRTFNGGDPSKIKKTSVLELKQR